MSTEIVVIAVVIAGTLGAFVLWPLLERDPEAVQRTTQRGTPRQKQALETLWNEQQRVLRAIRDLDFDYDLDKIPDTTYTDQRIYLIRLAVAIMQRMDSIEDEIAQQDAQVEALIATLRSNAG